VADGQETPAQAEVTAHPAQRPGLVDDLDLAAPVTQVAVDAQRLLIERWSASTCS
jgi:hypothetical protein